MRHEPSPPLRARIRWANVATTTAILATVVLAVAWYRATSDAIPHIPAPLSVRTPAAAAPVGEAGGAATSAEQGPGGKAMWLDRPAGEGAPEPRAERERSAKSETRTGRPGRERRRAGGLSNEGTRRRGPARGTGLRRAAAKLRAGMEQRAGVEQRTPRHASRAGYADRAGGAGKPSPAAPPAGTGQGWDRFDPPAAALAPSPESGSAESGGGDGGAGTPAPEFALG